MSLVGRAALLLALLAAAYALAMALGSRRPGRRGWEASSERAVSAVFGLTTLAGSAVVTPRAGAELRGPRRGAGVSARASRVCWPAS